MCMSYTPLIFNTAGGLPTNAITYKISNVYIGAVINTYGDIPRPLSGNIGFRTFHYVKQALSASSYTL